MMRGITALILFLFVFSGVKADSMSDFVDSIVNNIQTVDNNAFESQKRGYFVGGGVRYSVPNPTIQPLSFSPPRISAGCGGIDISLGSFSYLKFDDLVQKLQAVLQVAPALAFQLVLSNLCERCQAILSSLESISDIVNSLNMDACTLAKAGVGYAMKFVGEAGNNETNKGTKEDANDWIKTVQTNLVDFQKAINDWKKEVTGAYDCMVLTGKDYESCIRKGGKSALFFEGGILEYIKQNSRLKNEPYFDLLIQIVRAYIGDFIVTASDVSYIGPCQDLSSSMLGIVCATNKDAKIGLPFKNCLIGGTLGVTFYAERINDLTNNSCKFFDHGSILSEYRNMVQRIYQKIRTGQPLDGTEASFVASSVFPVYTYLSWVARAEELGLKDSSAEIDALSGYLAQAMYIDAFYYRLSRILGNLVEALSSLSSACATAQKDASDSLCKGSLLDDYKNKVKELQKVVSDSRRKIWDRFSSDFKIFRKNYENSWRFVMNTLRTYGLEKSYNFSASVE